MSLLLRIIAVPLLAAGVACADKPRRVSPTQPQLGTTHTAPPGTLPPDTQPPPITPPREVRELVESVRAIEPDGHHDHARLVDALRALRGALIVVGTPQSEETARMDHAIEQLASSPSASSLHADYVRTALEQAVVIMANGAPRATALTAEYSRAVSAFANAVRAVNPDRPLLDQHAQARFALELAVRAVHVAIGAPPPFVDVVGGAVY